MLPMPAATEGAAGWSTAPSGWCYGPVRLTIQSPVFMSLA